MKITLRQLEVFVAVAKTGNMSLAAQIVHLSQSACSMALATLETQLGSVLFNRHGKRVSLNDSGKLLFPKASNIIAQVEDMQTALLDNDNGAFTGQLLLGASTTIGTYLLPALIGSFMAANSQARITLRVANTEQIIKQVLNFELDIGMIEGNCYASDLHIQPWYEDELIIIAAPQHPLAKKASVTHADLRSSHWILREPGSGTREIFEAAIGGKMNAFLELGHTEAIKQAVQTGIGISCLSKMTVVDALKSKKLVKIDAPFLKLTRYFSILLHKEKHQSALLREFSKSLGSGPT